MDHADDGILDTSRIQLTVSGRDIAIRCKDCPGYLLSWLPEFTLAEINMHYAGHRLRRHKKEKLDG